MKTPAAIRIQKEGPRDPSVDPAEQLNEFCKEPPCASDRCRKAKQCLYAS